MWLNLNLSSGLFSNANFKREEEEGDNGLEGEVSLCPDCNNPLDISMSTCTICECCAQCALGEQKKERGGEGEGIVGGEGQQDILGDVSYNLSSATASWNYLNRKDEETKTGEDEEEEEEEEPSGEEDASFSCDSVIDNFVAESVSRRKPVMNLQRQLKEVFGARMERGEALKERKVHHGEGDALSRQDSNFLAEYAGRKSLFDSQQPEPAVLVREGETVELTEEMFRGDLKGTLKKLVAGGSGVGGGGDGSSGKGKDQDLKKKHNSNNSSSNNGGSEMGDSGISSPPAAPSLNQVVGPRLEETKEEEEESEKRKANSGLEELQQQPQQQQQQRQQHSHVEDKKQKLGIPGMKKRDTMIRELKSKLREKFHQGVSDASSSSENSSLTQPAGIGSGEGALPPGTVMSRRETMGPQLSKVLGIRVKQKKAEEIAAASFAMAKRSPISVLPSAVVTQQTDSSPDAGASFRLKDSPYPNISSNSTEGTKEGDKPNITTFKSIYEGRVGASKDKKAGGGLQFEVDEGSSVYDPSLPEELKKSVPPSSLLFRGGRPFTPPANAVPTATSASASASVGGDGFQKEGSHAGKSSGGSGHSGASSTCSACGGQRCVETGGERQGPHVI